MVYWYVFSKNDFLYKNSPSTFAAAPLENNKPGFKKIHYDISGNVLPQSAVFIFPAKAIFTVSKKNVKNASDRNHIKRLVKEAYRKNKSSFYSFLKEKGLLCLVAFNYIGTQPPKQENIEKHLVVSLQNIIKEIKKKITANPSIEDK